jgi:hypothetical protein
VNQQITAHIKEEESEDETDVTFTGEESEEESALKKPPQLNQKFAVLTKKEESEDETNVTSKGKERKEKRGLEKHFQSDDTEEEDSEDKTDDISTEDDASSVGETRQKMIDHQMEKLANELADMNVLLNTIMRRQKQIQALQMLSEKHVRRRKVLRAKIDTDKLSEADRRGLCEKALKVVSIQNVRFTDNPTGSSQYYSFDVDEEWDNIVEAFTCPTKPVVLLHVGSHENSEKMVWVLVEGRKEYERLTWQFKK